MAAAVHVLDRPVMSAREAARQLRIPPSTLLYWLEGGERHGVRYAPVLRDEPTGDHEMAWGEVVEARYLRAYRQKNVSMQQLRPVIAALRHEFAVPYPLAHFTPFVDSGRRLLLEVQDRVELPEALRMVYEATTGRLVLDRRVVDFLDRVDFATAGDREALRMRPAGPDSPIVMDRAVASASATVHGVRTEVLVELADSGVPIEAIAADFRLPLTGAGWHFWPGDYRFGVPGYTSESAGGTGSDFAYGRGTS